MDNAVVFLLFFLRKFSPPPNLGEGPLVGENMDIDNAIHHHLALESCGIRHLTIFLTLDKVKPQ